MTDYDLLKKKMADSGMTITAIAQKSGILRESLYNKLAGIEFKASEIQALSDVLRLTTEERDQIFFAPEVDK